MQHQNFAEVLHTFAVMFDRLPLDQQRRAEDIILRLLSALGEFVLTAELDSTLSALVGALNKSAQIDGGRGSGRARTIAAIGRQTPFARNAVTGKIDKESSKRT